MATHAATRNLSGLARALAQQGLVSEGDADALDRLVPILYEELKRLAHARLRGEAQGHTLSTTGLE